MEYLTPCHGCFTPGTQRIGGCVSPGARLTGRGGEDKPLPPPGGNRRRFSGRPVRCPASIPMSCLVHQHVRITTERPWRTDRHSGNRISYILTRSAVRISETSFVVNRSEENHPTDRARQVTRFESNPAERMPSVVVGEMGGVTAL
jgi:hypothetical protein